MKSSFNQSQSKWIFVLTLSFFMIGCLAIITAGIMYAQYFDFRHNEKVLSYMPDKGIDTGSTSECDRKSCSPPSCVCASDRNINLVKLEYIALYEYRNPPLYPSHTSIEVNKETGAIPHRKHPGNLTLMQVPMMIMVTFDDYVNSVNYDNLIALSELGFKNKNGCPLKMTLFVDNDGTNFNMVKDFYNRGHEIGSHSQTHKFPKTWWATATKEQYRLEFEGQREKLHKLARIPKSEIRGVRVPFLEPGGDALWSMMRDAGFLYDSSYVSRSNVTKGESLSWPFTLDYLSNIRTCYLSETVTRPYPGLWEVPLTRYFNLATDSGCDMLDTCETGDGALNVSSYLWRHFAYHYRNRVPMGLFVHSQWFDRRPGSFDGLVEFLHQVGYIPDVWFVTVGQVVDWMKKPTAIKDLGSFEPWLCKLNNA